MNERMIIMMNTLSTTITKLLHQREALILPKRNVKENIIINFESINSINASIRLCQFNLE